MLYQKICAVSLTVYAFLSSYTRGSVHYVKDNTKTDIFCANNEQCDIYCNIGDLKDNGNEYHCNSATDCYFHCDEKKCGTNIIIRGQNANNLYITEGSNGQECLKGAVIYAPDAGNAYFSTESKKGFKDMTVRSGPDTNEIIIDCDSPLDEKDDCKNMNVYASTAQYLRITVGGGLAFEEATVECPVDSSYNGPDIAPCIIDATNGIMSSIEIIAPDGTPHGVYIAECSSCNSVSVICDNIDPLNGADEGNTDTYPLDIFGDCWWTDSPTVNPTAPTIHPTINPTVPTMDPTKDPTMEPTISPTSAPTTPSIPPTKFPTQNPTIPTVYPTNNPSKDPTMDPTIDPTSDPTFDPTVDPTFDPTRHPTTDPTNAPTMSPTIAPTLSPSSPTAAPTITWNMCNPNKECKYITDGTAIVTWSSATDLPRDWLQNAIKEVFLFEIQDYIHAPNTLIEVTIPTSTTANISLHIGTEDKQGINELRKEIESSDIIETNIGVTLTKNVEAKSLILFGESSFDVISVEIFFNDDEDGYDKEKANGSDTVNIVFGVLFAMGVIGVGVFLYWKRRMMTKKREMESHIASVSMNTMMTHDVWEPGTIAHNSNNNDIIPGLGTAQEEYAVYNVQPGEPGTTEPAPGEQYD